VGFFVWGASLRGGLISVDGSLPGGLVSFDLRLPSWAGAPHFPPPSFVSPLGETGSPEVNGALVDAMASGVGGAARELASLGQARCLS